MQPDEYYHVLNRASVRARLFYAARDYRAFVRILSDTVDEFDLQLLSYCVMPNHWHLVVRPRNAQQLSKSMHWLTCTHAHRWCKGHDRNGPGPLYQGRYRAIHVEPDIHLLRACRYVERNALKARLVDRAQDWRWCSAHQRLRNGLAPRLMPLPFLTPESWIRCLNESPDDDSFAAAIRQNRPFGSDDWAHGLVIPAENE
ncbi:MAG: transposase [Acidobacteriota bacterium]|nr:transposase [Acidobacteriota bacterium]